MGPDDVIVLSENTDCNHVYHKECLVHYLATQALQMNQGGIHGSRQINVATNTCPTSRRANYCRVRDSEFMFLLIQKAEQYYTVSSRSSAAARIVAQRSPWATTPPWPQTTPDLRIILIPSVVVETSMITIVVEILVVLLLLLLLLLLPIPILSRLLPFLRLQ